MGITSDELLRQKIRALMKQHQITQFRLAQLIPMSQSLLSRRLTGVQRFQIRDLDAIAHAFQVTVPELFFDQYGQWDRRSGIDRRKTERRQRQQVLYDATLELNTQTARLGFAQKEDGSK